MRPANAVKLLSLAGLAWAAWAFCSLETEAWLQPPLPRRAAAVAAGAAVVAPPAARAQFSLFAPDIPAPEDVAAVPPDAQVTASGLAYKVLELPACETEAECAERRPQKFDKVTVDYTGWTRDGKMFDSSIKRGQRASFGVSQVIKGWTEGLQLMAPGEKRRFWIPAALAYGENPRGGAPGGPLVFDVTLYSVEKGPRVPTPPDVAGPPADAEVTESGLASKVLKKGPGTRKPMPTSVVTVDYSGWTTDGQLFDSSVLRGQRATFPLNKVIPGWTEGLLQMVEGEKRRFWIPAKLAYGEKPAGGRPGGMLVFDVTLYGIE